jgi:flagellar hook-associated protein 3 FlgL
MRVTDNIRTNSGLTNLRDLRERHLAASEQASSGKRVNRPSDDPAAAARLSRNERWREQTTSLGKALDLGRADLDLAEASLASAGDLLTRAKELALTAANGSATADVRASAAQEIQGIRDSLLDLANTKGVRGYIFAGSKTDAAAFDASFTFQGDSYEHAIPSGPSSEVVVSASGARAFTSAGGRDIFQDLGNLVTALTGNDQAGIMASLDTIDAGQKQITLERARAGVNMTRVDQSQEMLVNTQFLIDNQNAEIGGADPTESLSNLVTLEQSLQRSMTVMQRLFGLDAFSLLGGS